MSVESPSGAPGGRSTGPSTPRPPRLRERAAREVPGWAACVVAALGAVGCLVLTALSEGCLPGFAEWPDSYPSPALQAARVAAVVCAVLACFAVAGLTRGADGVATVLSRRRGYRGTVRGTGLVWVSPLLGRHRVDVRLRHWRTDEIHAVDLHGIALRAETLVVWRIRDTARAMFAVVDYEKYLAAVVEAAVVKVMAAMPGEACEGDGPSLRDNEELAARLTAVVASECRPVGLEVFYVRPSRVGYAPDMAAAMRQQQLLALDARLRQTVVDNLLNTVEDTVEGLSRREMASLDARQRSKLMCDLTVAFYAARGAAPLSARELPGAPGDRQGA
ncbi:hypothetical protein AF335_08925 [Streptomyces eurocidicus]|uniref:Band 7 domain-containing protein n=1 Tax=Streptomyces eurocidicus TaxID=66423 RepID=A0A2N8P0U8_STREU|nr:SPFH domain-containing protein [Streptomyces eurocidicus]MBB5121761.1 hypothetical protein [Streptomyces eurocidicus]PNE34646.1 hypothetical protein AF335_08925 [Streptomyces eurocidicus]